jgi:hypothetical protein
MTQRDWYAWHDRYDDPDSSLCRRLLAVQERVRATLDRLPAGPVRAISLCAGQGRDLIGVLADHPRRHDVTARLVELDARNAEFARRAAADAGLSGVEVVTGDAAGAGRYADLVPADLVLLCGIFGNITDDDIRAVVDRCPQLCATGGSVVWTRHREEPDLVPEICRWFAERDFELEALSDREAGFGVAAHRFTGRPQTLEAGARMFTFVGKAALGR